MRTSLAIARKELAVYFTTPLAYLIFFVMAGAAASVFVVALQTFTEKQEEARKVTWSRLLAEQPGAEIYRNLTDGVVLPLWSVILIVTLFAAPFLSMRLFAEERRQKTFELLMTAPVRPVQIVLGKYLGGLGVITATLGITLVFPLLLAAFGNGESGSALEWSTVLTGYLGMLLWGATCMAIGLFFSSVTESQMLSAFLTFGVLLLFWMLHGVAMSAEEPLRSVLDHLAFSAQLVSLRKGAVELKALVYFGSVILFSLVLTHRAVEAHRWT